MELTHVHIGGVVTILTLLGMLWRISKTIATREDLDTLRKRFEKHQQESDTNDRRVQEDLRRQLDSIERQLAELRAVYMQNPPNPSNPGRQ